MNGERGGGGGILQCFLNGDIQQIIEFFWAVLQPPSPPGVVLTCWVVAVAMTVGLLRTLSLKLLISGGEECHDNGDNNDSDDLPQSLN